MWTIIEIKQNYDHRKELFVGGVTTLQKKNPATFVCKANSD